MNSEAKDESRERPRRRRYDPVFNRALVEQKLEPGASVARIAREHGINANQLFYRYSVPLSLILGKAGR